MVACGDLFGPDDDGERLWISATGIDLVVGDTLRIGVTMERRGRIYQTPEIRAPWPKGTVVTWASSNPAVVRVDGSGLLEAMAEGAARLTASVGSLSDTGTVRIRSRNAEQPSPFVSLATGGTHSCAVTAEGTAWCWGGSWYGQLGDGSLRKYTARLSPQRVSGEQRFVSVSSAANHTCALATTKRIYCWGENENGEVGDGTQRTRLVPSLVKGSTTWSSVAAGIGFTCGLSEGGLAHCWGRFSGSNTPRLITDRVFTMITAGGSHACALTAEGAAWCWWSNEYGQLGDGTAVDADRPTAVAGGHTFRALSAGTAHTCGVRTDGAALCWGNGWNDRLGTGGETVATPTLVASQERFVSVSAGLEHSCAISETGHAWCWGMSDWGQVGTGLTAEPGLTLTELIQPVPAPIASGERFSDVSAAMGRHTCGLTFDGAAYCWGMDLSGQLGYGAQGPYPGTLQYKRALPTRVAFHRDP